MMKNLRERAGLSQAEVARVLDVRQSAVAMWESGVNHPSTSRLRAIARLYGVSIDKVIEASYGCKGGAGSDPVSENT